MKFLTILLICITIAIGIVTGDVVFKETQLNWKQSTPLYTGGDNIFMTDKTNALKKSTDAGQNWVTQKDTNGNTINANKGYIYKRGYMLAVNSVSSSTTSCSVSSDNGETFKTVSYTYPITSIEPHDDIEGLVIARSNQFILISKDFGLSWTNTSAETNANTLFKPPGIYYSYSDPLWDISEDEPVFFAILSGMGGSGVFSVSRDLGKTYKTILNGAVDIIHTENYFYVGVVDPVKGGNKLYVKSLLLKASTTLDGFLLCEFPFGEDVQPNDFRILDDSAGAIFMGIVTSKNGQSSNKDYGYVYVSNSAGNVFTLQLKHVYTLSGVYDFMPMYGAKGSYLFNGVKNFDEVGGVVETQSFISYDNGGAWSRLKVPTGETCTNSQTNCYLNVHGASAFLDRGRGYGPFYSIEKAPGLVLATGTFNPVLSSNPVKNRLVTVYSTDNGQSWKKIFDDPTIYEFGAYGSTIIFATALEDTDTIFYSFDQGATQQSFSLNSKYDIINIITDPNNSGNKFILLVENSQNQASIIAVDLTSVLPPVCQASDLTSYTTECILGQKKTYSAVKSTSRCILDKERTLSIFTCDCTIEDFECDIGYESASSAEPTDAPETQLQCIRSLTSTYVPVTKENCVPGELYYVSKGYRMVAGSQCANGVNSTFAPTTLMCPGLKSGSHGKGWVAAIVIGLLVVGAGGFVFYLHKFNPELKQKLMKKVGMNTDRSSGPKYSVVGIKPNSLADDEFGIEEDDAQILNDNDLQDDDDF